MCGVRLTGDGECVECLIDAGDDGLDIPLKFTCKRVKEKYDIDEIFKFYQMFATNSNLNFLSDYDTMRIVLMVLMKAICGYDFLCCYKNESCNLVIECLIT